MASSLVSRPHLTQRPVRAATLASPTRARLAAGAGALGGRGVRCQAQAAGDLDAQYMRRCVELARKAAGHTSPNPMVGCVIVRDGRVVGEGFHPKAGQPHAEVACLPISLFNIFFGCLFSQREGHGCLVIVVMCNGIWPCSLASSYKMSIVLCKQKPLLYYSSCCNFLGSETFHTKHVIHEYSTLYDYGK
jgi:hypothetical protein